MSQDTNTPNARQEAEPTSHSLVRKGCKTPEFPDAHLLTLLDHMPFGVVIYNLTGEHPADLRFVYLNVAALNGSHGLLHNALGRYLPEALPNILDELTSDGLFWGIVKSAKGESPTPLSFEYKSNVDKGEWYRVRVIQLAPGYAAAVYENITEQKKAQELLSESEERFRSTFAQAAVGIAHVDLQGRFLRANSKCLEVLGYSEEELLKISFQEITHPKDLQQGNLALRQMIHGEIPYCSFEKRYVRKDGSVLWAQLTSSAVFHEDGSIKSLVSVIEDIGGRKRIEETLNHHMNELARSNRDLNQFVNITAHGLQHPLEAIEAQVEALTQELAGTVGPEPSAMLTRLQQQVAQISTRLRGLQRFAQVGRKLYPLDEVNVAALIGDLITMLAIPEGFEIKIRPPLPTIKTYRAPLEQILQHILCNALHHHDKAHGTIEISIKKRESFYEFCVQDDGPGIPKADQEKIFDMFETLSVTDNEVQNCGAGLAIVKKSVQQQGGRVWLESGVGRGATFYFEWPIKANVESKSDT